MTIIALVASIAASAQYYAFPQNNSVTLRATPSTAGKKLGTLYSNSAPVLVVGEPDYEAKWIKVIYNGKEAYLAADYTGTIMQEAFPEQFFGKDIESEDAWDKTRFSGTLCVTKLDNTHALITMEWMRMDPKTTRSLPAENWSYIGKIEDGKVTATHQLPEGYVDPESKLADLMTEASLLEDAIPVLIDEFNGNIEFSGARFTMW